jgi:ElaB/YqjD/DUF883 family membrane-anchored ribosome-binding protein
MNSEISESDMTTGTSGSTGLNGNGGVVHRVAQKAHEAVDKLEQTVASGSEKVTTWQQEYGDVCREQIKSNPLTAVGIAFAAGILFNRILGR